MWLFTLEISGAQLRSVTEIVLKSEPRLCVHRGPMRYGFSAGAEAMQYRVKIA